MSRLRACRCVAWWWAAAAALVLLLSPAHRAFPYSEAQIDTAQRVWPGDAQIRVWDGRGAEELARAELAQKPEDPELHFLLGRGLFYQGRYEEALAAFDRAAAGISREDPGFDEVVAYRAFVERTLAVTRGLSRFERDGVVVFLDPNRDGVLLHYLFDTMTATIQTIGKDLGFRPGEPVRIEIYPDAGSFYLASSLTRRDIEVSGAVGICKFNKVMMLSPRILARGYRWLDSLSHEYVHLALVNLTANNAPIWLQEGVAKYEERRWRGEESILDPAAESLLAQALAEGSLVSFQEMEPSLVRLPTPERVTLAYAQAATVIEYVVREKGQEGVWSLLAHLKGAASYGAAASIEKLFALPFSEFEEKWKGYLWQKGLKVYEGAEVDRYVLLSEEERLEKTDLREIRSAVARQRLQLADGLLERGHPQTAEIEYRRSLREDPASPILSIRLGRLLAMRGKAEEAVELLEASRQLQPNFPSIYTVLGDIYLGRQELYKAEEVFLESVAINPYDPAVHRALWEIYSARGEDHLSRREEEAYKHLTGSP